MTNDPENCDIAATAAVRRKPVTGLAIPVAAENRVDRMLELRTYVRMGRDRQGNSRASDERNRLLMALRGRQADRVLKAARTLQDTGEMTLGDAAYVSAFLADVDDERYPVAAARLAARITLASRLGLEAFDELLDLVANLPDPERLAKLLIYARDADLATARARRVAD